MKKIAQPFESQTLGSQKLDSLDVKTKIFMFQQIVNVFLVKRTEEDIKKFIKFMYA